MADRVICCVVQSDSDVFKVKAFRSVDNFDVADLKMLVFKVGKNNMFHNICRCPKSDPLEGERII